MRLTFALLALVIGSGSTAIRGAAEAGEAVLVEFSAPQCQPCRAMKPVLAELEGEGVPIRHVDLAAEPHLGTRYGVQQTPTFVVLSGGEEVTRLVGMQTAEELRAALAIDPSGPLVATGSQQQSPPSNETPQTALAAIDSENRPSQPASRTGRGNAAAPSREPTSEPMPSRSVADAVERARAATVRLRIHDGNGSGVGTGTIIDTQGDEALVMTCGHLFRETKGEGELEIELFVGGETKTVAGQVIDYDADERDIALVAIRPGFSVEPVELIAPGDEIETGQAVFSFGCDRGADPSRHDTRITGVNKYNQHLGMSNLEIAGAPIDGRSGGGLFDQRGRLIGVCNAADYEGDVGIYTGPGSVHWQLDRVNLTHLYQGPAKASGQTPQGETPDRGATDRLASLSGEAAPQTSPALNAPERETPSPDRAAEAAPAAAISGDNREAGDREVIVIIRDRKHPDAGSRMIELDRPSDDLIRRLESQARR